MKKQQGLLEDALAILFGNDVKTAAPEFQKAKAGHEGPAQGGAPCL